MIIFSGKQYLPLFSLSFPPYSHFPNIHCLILDFDYMGPIKEDAS